MTHIKGESSPNPTASAGGIVEAIMESWKALARHGDDCEQCGEVVAELREIPDDWLPFYDHCCPVGQELFGRWADARQGMVEQFKDSTTRRGGSDNKTANSLGGMMLTLQQRRKRLGMIGLDQREAEIRALALESIPTEAFNKLLAVSDDGARESQIRALVDAQRHKHVRVEIRAVARSIYDDRVLFRWFCSCGKESLDHFSTEDARSEWGQHAGWVAPQERLTTRQCRAEGCEEEFVASADSRRKYCSDACKTRSWRAHLDR